MENLINLTLGQIFGGIAGIVVVLSVFIEITPIKVNPVSSFLTWLGKKTNHELMRRVDALSAEITNVKGDVSKIKGESDERNAVLCRVRILRFGDELRRGLRHSQDSFDQVLSDMDDYDQYCALHKDFKNNKTVVTQGKIREEYARCLRENDFL